MPTAGLILARGGSKGLPGKNLRRIGDRSLLGWAIMACQAAETVDQVFVSTEDGGIAKEAETYGANVIVRPEELAMDLTLGIDALRHAVDNLPSNADKIAHVECTCFPNNAADIDRCVRAIDEEQADTAVTARRECVFLWRRGPDGYAFPINQLTRQNRQQSEPEYRLTGGCFAFRRPIFERTHQLPTGSVVLVETTHDQIDIDGPLEFAIAELIHWRENDRKHLGI